MPDVEMRADTPPLSQKSSAARRTGAGILIWLTLIMVAGVSLVLHMQSHREVRRLSERLVATQDTFAQLGEAASGDLSRLQGQLSEMEGMRKEWQQALQQAGNEGRSEIKALEADLRQALRRLQDASGTQNASVENLALQGKDLAADAARQASVAAQALMEVEQRMQEQADQQARELSGHDVIHRQLEESLALQASLHAILQEQVAAVEQQLQAQALTLEAMDKRLDEQPQLLAELLVEWKSRLVVVEKNQRALEQEMQAFRAQITRRLQEAGD